MPLLRPLRALRYGNDHLHRLPDLVSPAASGLPADRSQVGDVDAHNVRQLVRGDRGPLATDDEPPFTHAARLLSQWKQEGVLVRDPRPSYYALEQDAGRARRGLVALVRLAELDEGIVRPHEATASESKEQLVDQLQVTEAQFSLVMAMVPDTQGALRDYLEHLPERPLVDVVDGDGVRSRLWREEDPALQLALAEALRDEPAVILDGHHRYEAALEVRRRAGGQGHRERPLDYVLMLLIPASDPGLQGQPTQRVLTDPLGPEGEAVLAGLDAWFDARDFEGPEDFEDFLANPGGIRVGLVREGLRRGLRLREGLDLPLPPTLADVDAAVAEHLILAPLREAAHQDPSATGRSGSLWSHNASTASEVAERVFAGEAELALFLRAPRPEQVLRVALAGQVMPAKSTNFVPKPPKGLLLASLRSF